MKRIRTQGYETTMATVDRGGTMIIQELLVTRDRGQPDPALICGFDPGRFALCALLYARFASFKVGTGKIKSQGRVRFDGHQPKT